MKINLTEPVQISQITPEYYNVLSYGKNGVGKTEFAASWPKPILLIDTDDGWLSIKSSPRIKDKNNIFRLAISDKADDPAIKQPVGFELVMGILQVLYDTGEYPAVAPDNKPIRPKTIILDSLTTTAELAMTYTLFTNKHQFQQPTLPDYGKQMRVLRNLVTMGKSIRVNFICLADEQYQRDELSGRTWCLPLVTGKLAAEIGLYFDEVYHQVVQEQGGKHKYLIETKATGLITAKSRLDLPSPIEANYAAIEKEVNKP